MATLAELELNVLSAEDRFDVFPELIVQTGAGRGCAIVAHSLGLSSEILFCPDRAAVVAGVLESICGTCKAGGCESFEDIVHVHV